MAANLPGDFGDGGAPADGDLQAYVRLGAVHSDRGLGQRVKIRAAHAQATRAGDGAAEHPGGRGSGVWVLDSCLCGDLGDHAVGYRDPAQFGAAGQRCGPGLGYGGHLSRRLRDRHPCVSMSPLTTLATT